MRGMREGKPVTQLRDAIAVELSKTAAAQGLPARFQIHANREHGKRFDITDTETGRTLTVDLGDVHGAVQGLAFFYGTWKGN